MEGEYPDQTLEVIHKAQVLKDLHDMDYSAYETFMMNQEAISNGD